MSRCLKREQRLIALKPCVTGKLCKPLAHLAVMSKFSPTQIVASVDGNGAAETRRILLRQVSTARWSGVRFGGSTPKAAKKNCIQEVCRESECVCRPSAMREGKGETFVMMHVNADVSTLNAPALFGQARVIRRINGTPR